MSDSLPLSKTAKRDHGGGLDAAVAQYGGTRSDWIDLSTGINPTPYPLSSFEPQDWTALPDQTAQDAVIDAARRFWRVPKGAMVLPAPGASALIALLPLLSAPGRVRITLPTYNEHAAAFRAQGWTVQETGPADARVLVHPNNPDGHLWQASDADAPLCVIDESFCDVTPEASLIRLSDQPGVIVLKSFGKFWGLAGARLGFAIAPADMIARLTDLLGPWPVSGPALRLGAQALSDTVWAETTRSRLQRDAIRLDQIMQHRSGTLIGGTNLFRLYQVDNAARMQERLARHRIWSRIFPYSDTMLRLGLPTQEGWSRLEQAL